jgi:hypothetical protein
MYKGFKPDWAKGLSENKKESTECGCESSSSPATKPKSKSYSPKKNSKSGNYAKVKKGKGRGKNAGGGMTAKGVADYNRKTGGNLKTAVTTPPSKLDPDSKAAKRRKSFCARSKGWTSERGRAARRKWNC